MNDQNNNDTLNSNQSIESAMNFNIPNTDNVINNTQLANYSSSNESVSQIPVSTGAMNFSVTNTNNMVSNMQSDNSILHDTNNVSEVANQMPQDNIQTNNSQFLNISSPVDSAISFNTSNENVTMNAVEQNLVSNVTLGTISDVNVIQPNTVNESIEQLTSNNNNQISSNNINNISQTQELPTNTNNSINGGFDDSEKVKKKTSPVVIIALILVILVGLAAGYYFLLETPKKIFGTAYDKLLSSINDTKILTDGYVNYDLSLNISSEDKNIKRYADVINQISINGTSGYNRNDKTFATNGMILYKNNELLNLSLLLNGNTNISYVKFNNLLDKVLMIEPDDDSNGEPIVSTTFDNNIDDYIKLRDSMLNALKKALEKANYKKELVDFNGSKATKSSLFIDKAFIEELYNILLQDDSFIRKNAKVNNVTEDKIKVDLKKQISEFKNENEKIIIYTSLIKNEFLKLELDSSDSTLVVNKNGNNYNYEYKENNTLKYNGILSVNKVADETILNVSMNMSEEKINLNISCTYSKTDAVNMLDIANAVDINKLSEAETNELTSKITSNNAFKELLGDLGLDEESVSSLESMI